MRVHEECFKINSMTYLLTSFLGFQVSHFIPVKGYDMESKRKAEHEHVL